MRILITGAAGHLGQQIAAQLQAHTVTGVDINTMDITDRQAVQQTFASVQPELVIHCAALTAVDYCAEHPQEALRANAVGTKNITLACQSHQAALLYVSTNEVFAGLPGRFYGEYDLAEPANPYAYSKWVGEQIVRELLPQHYIVRTSWLFAPGGKNFLHKILNMAREGTPLRVVTNEISSPTYSVDLAEAIVRLIKTEQYGIYHLVNDGYASRYSFARHALDLAGFAETPIEPVGLVEYWRASRPPEHAVLKNFMAAELGITLRPWQDALAAFLGSEQLLKK